MAGGREFDVVSVVSGCIPGLAAGNENGVVIVEETTATEAFARGVSDENEAVSAVPCGTNFHTAINARKS